MSPLISSSQKRTTFFAHRFIAFYCFHSGVTPSRVSPYIFFTCPTRFSTILCKFAHKKCFPSGVTPLEGVTRGGPPPHPPSDATVGCGYKTAELLTYLLTAHYSGIWGLFRAGETMILNYQNTSKQLLNITVLVTWQWPLRRSRSLKATDFYMYTKLPIESICDFLLVIITNLPPPLSCTVSKI